jgi:hypothetical protein
LKNSSEFYSGVAFLEVLFTPLPFRCDGAQRGESGIPPYEDGYGKAERGLYLFGTTFESRETPVAKIPSFVMNICGIFKKNPA